MTCDRRPARVSDEAESVALFSDVVAEDAPAAIRRREGRLAWIMKPRLRLVRFLAVGGVTALVQLGLLALLLNLRWPSLVGNGAALSVAMQVNFVLSAGFTWSDRWSEARPGEQRARHMGWVVVSRWARFMGAAAVTVLLNEALYDVAQDYVPDLVAAALSSAVIAALNYLLVSRLVFRRVPAR